MEQNRLATKTMPIEQRIYTKNKPLIKFVSNILLLISVFIVSVSGMIIQIDYHIRHNCDTQAVLFLDRTAWYSVHVWCSVVFMLIIIYHIVAHLKWYGSVFKHKLSRKSRPTIILTWLMLAVTITGFTPLYLSFFAEHSFLRFAIVEIHDKIAIIFMIMVFLHTMRRLKWYVFAAKNISSHR